MKRVPAIMLIAVFCFGTCTAEIVFASGADGTDTCWALGNLILTILNVIGAVLLLLRFIFSARSRNSADRFDYIKIYGALDEQPETETHKRELLYTIFATAAAVLSVILFLIFEDIQRLMVLTDRLTVPTIVLLAFEVVMTVLVLTGKTKTGVAEFKSERLIPRR
ncbi:MAG: hypothetical protein LBN36_07905 [Clostridiales Family XIII bacterium]|nr:hypothetical protein [Clostridiales Family XIII bacterium]